MNNWPEGNLECGTNKDSIHQHCRWGVSADSTRTLPEEKFKVNSFNDNKETTSVDNQVLEIM